METFAAFMPIFAIFESFSLALVRSGGRLFSYLAASKANARRAKFVGRCVNRLVDDN